MMSVLWIGALLLVVVSGRVTFAHVTTPIVDGGVVGEEGGTDGEEEGGGEERMARWRSLKEQLLSLKGDPDLEDDSPHTRHPRTLFSAGYTGCSCSDLAALAAQISLFEEEVKSIGEMENKLSIISTAIKQLGIWVDAGIRGPQGHEGIPGTQGPPGLPGDDGDEGPTTIRTRQGIPGPPGHPGPSGVRGPKGNTGDCIKGNKGTQGKRGNPGVGFQGLRGLPGPSGLVGNPAPDLKTLRSAAQAKRTQ
ncbi:collagen alpha-2(IX) chain-like [Homarus americanus]|uniref:Collagen alpha-1(XXVII) chain-like 2 n=1 Tax=Homarus americanus TaxID=6706 RepID=A0A8J5MQW2_HOMAM|nr:collagen alpha-2(IX) chain-like [Homarus americanus]KAG7159982.1 Collagen alpha-1(XXVII) chain-like 2 [Homarus americanus]